MAELATKYLGLTLRNPLIIGSSGLTENISGLKNLENSGAGAVVLKSLFEEQIHMNSEKDRNEAKKSFMIYSDHSETFDYLDAHHRQSALSDYLDLIRQTKKELMIPVIASINCLTPSEWIPFAKKIKEAGADALELNIAFQTTNSKKTSAEIEKLYVDILKKVKSEAAMPVSVKLSPYFTNLSHLATNLSDAGASSIVLFNRFYNPDINIDKMEVTTAEVHSTPGDYLNSLRWISVLSGSIRADLCASTGIHSGETAIKQILAGASAVQVTSAVYKNGDKVIGQILKAIESWMDKKGYNYIDQFKGKMSKLNVKNPEMFERIQFMKYFAQIK